jgi:hypothetical protein
MTNPRTQGINRNPIKKVTDPHSIKVNDIPNSNDANPAGVISGNLLLNGVVGIGI